MQTLCVVDDDGANSESLPCLYSPLRFYLDSDLGVRCSSEDYVSEEHDSIKRAATGLMIVWPIGTSAIVRPNYSRRDAPGEKGDEGVLSA